MSQQVVGAVVAILITGVVCFWAGAQWSTNRWLDRIRELLTETKKEFHPRESLPWFRDIVREMGWEALRKEFVNYYQTGSRADRERLELREIRDRLLAEIEEKLTPPEDGDATP